MTKSGAVVTGSRSWSILPVLRLTAAGRCSASRLRLVRFGPGLVVLVADVGDVHPRVTHLVDRAIAKANPLVRIRVELVGGRIVVPGSDVNDGALREHRGRIIRVDVVRHPVEVEMIDVADDLRAAVRQNGFYLHRLAAQVHMRLEILETCRSL